MFACGLEINLFFPAEEEYRASELNVTVMQDFVSGLVRGAEAELGCEKLWSDSKIHTNMSTGDDVHTQNTHSKPAELQDTDTVSQTNMFHRSGYRTLTSENQSESRMEKHRRSDRLGS